MDNDVFGNMLGKGPDDGEMWYFYADGCAIIIYDLPIWDN